ncbi:HPr kinase/phosphatase C-terminal domain-containing protein [Novosphingobium sp. ZN18A2]|uniref:HPr kinase/phosphorylase n=1 Tax=Novosphingobium sp. ZN18A2 TaxID=3079861 RepID=UPI0030CA98B6
MTTIRQATCVAIGRRAILIEGPPGSGKSSLALALIDRGATLVGDDGIVLEPVDGLLVAAPHPRTEGKLEVRNVGLVSMPAVGGVPVALVVRLSPDAPRWISAPDRAVIEGCPLPAIALWPDSPALPLRAEYALDLYGLAID